MSKIRIGLICQVGYGNAANVHNHHSHSYRRLWEDVDTETVGTVSSGNFRWSQAIAKFNSRAVDFTAILGGYVWNGDAGMDDEDKLPQLQALVALSETLDNDIYNLIVNRDKTIFAGVGGASDPDIDDLYAAIGLTSPFGHNQGTVSNPYPSAANPRFYTTDIGSTARIVFLTRDDTGGNIGMSSGALTWLEDTALDTALPVIVLSSDYISTGDELTAGSSQTTGNNLYVNAEEIVTILIAARNVQAVIQGQTGYGWWDADSPSPAFTHGGHFRRDHVDYITLNGALMQIDAGGNRYYIIEIETDTIALTPSRNGGNVKVETFGIAEGAKNFDSFFIG